MNRLSLAANGSALWVLLLGMLFSLPARAGEMSEYRLKAAVLFNFAVFTEWPPEVGDRLTLCVYGPDPFGKELDELQGKAVGRRMIDVRRKPIGDALGGCQIVFVAPSAIASLPHVLEDVRGRQVLTVADSAGAARRGAVLSLAVEQNKVSFQANLLAARACGIKLSSKLLRLATEVIQ